MVPRTGKTQEQRDVYPESTVITGQLEQGVAKVIFIQVAVPAPKLHQDRRSAVGFRCAVLVVAAGVGMGMYDGAVAGNGKVFLRPLINRYTEVRKTI